MRFLIMANGDYGDLKWYRFFKDDFDQVILVDGGANWAERIGIIPHRVVGDLDSITREARDYAITLGAEFVVAPREKDETDTQIALRIAAEEGASEVVIWGGIGSRIDHTLSSLFSASWLVVQGVQVRFESPREIIHLIDRRLQLSGEVGQTVSLVALGGDVQGVTLKGFKYQLNKATLNCRWQHAVSNIISEPDPMIEIESGIVAVIHYRALWEE